MNESDARRAVLVRAFESPTPTAPWSEADVAWASREAGRAQGEAAASDAWVAARSRLAVARLAQRAPAVDALWAASAWPRGLTGGLVALAAALGVATDAVGSSGRINLLAPPLLGLLAWNLCVYVALIVSGWRSRPAGSVASGPLRRALAQGLQGLLRRATRGLPGHVAARHVADWLALARGLYAARIAAALHLAALAFALGLLASLYLRGIAFEYRAGWDSTFLGPTAVHGLLAFVLGPASHLSGIALPDAAHLARLRFALGPGENAAPWIHLIAITLALAVLLPRAALAAFAAWRERSLARRFPLPLTDAYFERLLRSQRGDVAKVWVQPYSYRLPPQRQAALGAALERELGTRVQWQLAPSVAMGEEQQAATAARPDDALVVALFALAATPERESHGAFLDALASAAPVHRVLIDESLWRERFPDSRRAERRELWRRWLRERGAPDEACWFADLAQAGTPAPESAA